MSYGSTFDLFDPTGKLTSKISRPLFGRDVNRQHKLINYEKQFDVSLSRATETGPDRSTVRDSMIAYSKKMQSIQDARRASGSIQSDPLFVRAQHIPKHSVRAPKKRRPMSFDELLGRDRESTRNRGKGAKQRPHSDKHKPRHAIKDDEPQLPVLGERLGNDGYNVQVSLASTSDYYDIMDLSLNSKNTRVERIQLKSKDVTENIHISQRRRNTAIDTCKSGEKVVPSNDYDKFYRTRKTGKVIPKDVNDDLTQGSCEKVLSLERTEDATVSAESGGRSSKLPPINNEISKRRPNRVKRMKLQDSSLEDIPEDTTIESEDISRCSQIARTRKVIPPPLHRQSLKSMEFVCTPSLDLKIEATQCLYKHEPVNTKRRAQKRFKKLIFLRDGGTSTPIRINP